MVNNKTMGLLLSILIMCNIFSCFSFTANQEMTVISSSCQVYEEASMSSNKIKIDNEEIILLHKDKVIAIEEINDFIKIKIPQKNNIEGFVYKYYLTQNTPQTVYPVFNAQLRTDSVIYDLNKQKTSYMALSGQEVFIYEGFQDKNEFTPVQIVLTDGSLYNGLIKTKDIKPHGISSLLIIGIAIIAACVTITLSIIFIKKNKLKKKQLKNN